MQHDTLKTEIKTAQAQTRTLRAEASKLIRQGRDLRKQARSEKDATRKAELDSQGWKCRDESMANRADANAGRYDRRVMHLAAALLNGRTYRQCEQKHEFKPYASDIAWWVQASLPPEMKDADENKAHAQIEALVRTWLQKEDVTFRSLLPKPVEAAA